MRGVAKFVTVIMLILLGMPAIACMLPGVEMTPEERACCKEMADHCGDMGMDPDHGCCVQIHHGGNQFLLVNERVRVNVESAVSFVVPDLASFTPLVSPVCLPASLEHSPPESPPNQFSILRI